VELWHRNHGSELGRLQVPLSLLPRNRPAFIQSLCFLPVSHLIHTLSIPFHEIQDISQIDLSTFSGLRRMCSCSWVPLLQSSRNSCADTISLFTVTLIGDLDALYATRALHIFAMIVFVQLRWGSCGGVTEEEFEGKSLAPAGDSPHSAS
jgi:hypothetical protein